MDTTINPTLVTGITAYYQGRPNTVFFGRYGTLEERIVRTPA